MKQTRRSFGTRRFIFLLLLAATCRLALAEPNLETELSPAEDAIIQKEIAKLKSMAEVKVVTGWSNAKLAANSSAVRHALQTLKKQDASVDRVFLGTDDPTTLALVSPARLTGSGQYRYSQGWQEITFTCDINPETGIVTSFNSIPAQNNGAH